MMGKVHNRNIFKCFFFSKISSIFGGMLELRDIFFRVTCQTRYFFFFFFFFFFLGGGGYRAYAGASLCSRKKSEYPPPPLGIPGCGISKYGTNSSPVRAKAGRPHCVSKL